MAVNVQRWSVLCLLLVAVWLGGCSSDPPVAVEETPASTPTEVTADETASEETAAGSEVSPANDPTAGLPVLEGSATVTMTVNGEEIVIEVDGEHAPVTAGNFVDLVQRGVYDGLVFHRVVKEPDPFVVQGGDPKSADPDVPPQALGSGSFIDPETDEPRLIPLEIQPEGADMPIYNQTFEQAQVTEPPVLTHTRGAVAMARSQRVDSASAQFYITLADHSFLDGSYAVFGYVTAGMEAVDNIEQGDVIESAQVTAGADNLVTADQR